MLNKVIVSTHCSRPQYTKQWIDKLRECEDIENTKIIACAEPVNEEVIELLRSIDYCEKEVVVNRSVLGNPRNSRQAVELGFEQSDFIIYVESDCLLSRDAITQTYRIGESHKNSSYPSVMLFNRHWDVQGLADYKKSNFTSVGEIEKFKSFAYGVWKNKYSPVLQVLCDETCPQCKENPQLNYPMMTRGSDFMNIGLSDELMYKIMRGFTHPSQDIIINNFFQYRGVRHLVFSVGRVINIGKIGGIHVNEDSPYDEKWWNDTIRCDIWADNILDKVAEFRNKESVSA